MSKNDKKMFVIIFLLTNQNTKKNYIFILINTFSQSVDFDNDADQEVCDCVRVTEVVLDRERLIVLCLSFPYRRLLIAAVKAHLLN